MINKYVFVDWSNIEPGYGKVWPYSGLPVVSPKGIHIKVHKPVINPAPVILPDKPWESSRVNAYATFLKINGKIHAWYETFTENDDMKLDDMKCNLAYAESDDGIHFTKPLLKIFPFCGSYDNNLLKNIHGTCVFYDANAPECERYKLVWVQYNRSETGAISCTLHGAMSADGINWNDINEPLLKNPGDTQNILDYDDEKGEYVIYTRQIKGYALPRRGISRTTSKDFTHFPDPAMILHNDPSDAPDWDYYTSGYHKWPGAKNAHIMMMDMYKRTSDRFEVYFLTSRDGVIWYRPTGQNAYIDGKTPCLADQMMISSTKGIIDNEDGTWSIYVHSCKDSHNAVPEERTRPGGCYRRAVIREDGFTSLSADDTGDFYTIKLDIVQDSLTINADIPEGAFIKAEIVDRNSYVPVDGYDLASCDRLYSSKVWQTVSWKGVSDLKELKGQTYRIHFVMQKSDLYAFSV
jgi:hypothetical protein